MRLKSLVCFGGSFCALGMIGKTAGGGKTVKTKKKRQLLSAITAIVLVLHSQVRIDLSMRAVPLVEKTKHCNAE